MCKSGSARVTMCVWVWHKHVFIVYASARHLNIWDTLLSFRLYTICEYLNVYHISISCRRGIFFVVFSSLPKMINNFSLCFAFTFYVKLQGHRVHSCVAPFINTCKFLAYLSPDTRAHTHYPLTLTLDVIFNSSSLSLSLSWKRKQTSTFTGNYNLRFSLRCVAAIIVVVDYEKVVYILVFYWIKARTRVCVKA